MLDEGMYCNNHELDVAGTIVSRGARAKYCSPVKPPRGSLPNTSRFCALVSRTLKSTYAFNWYDVVFKQQVRTNHGPKRTARPTHRRVVDLLHRWGYKEPHFLIDKAILCLSSDNMLSRRASARSTGQKCLPGAYDNRNALAQTLPQSGHKGTRTLVVVLVAPFRGEGAP